MFSVVILSFFMCVGASQPTYQEYVVYEELEKQLLFGEDGPFNIYTLAETFYPKVGKGPICVPISYTLICPNASSDIAFTDSINCTEFGFNSSFLWTQYDLNSPIGPLLLSYAWSGITLKGFDWEDSCIFLEDIHIVLNIENVTCRSQSILDQTLQALTAVAKFYAQNQGNRGSLGSSDTKGYAISWNEQDREARVFHASRYILTTMIVVLNMFVYFIAIAMTSYSYDILYNNIKKKKNPGYPVFWASVLLTLCWNVGPSWLVLSRDSNLLHYSLAVMVPLEFAVAVLVKKKSDFPIPCMQMRRSSSHTEYHYSWEKAVVFHCLACVVSHLVQVLAIWSILVFITFLAYYFSSIIVAFYLYPTQTLIKVVFLKAVAVCAVVNVALLFSNSKFWCRCSWRSFKHDMNYVVVVFSIALFLPILGFLVYVVGGILFTGSTQITGLQGVLTLLPSVFLVIAAWFTKGRLFPSGITETDPEHEILSDLEKGSTKQTSPESKSVTSFKPNGSKSGELSSYNSFDATLPEGDRSRKELDGEQTPLLH